MDNNYMKTILSGVKEWTENLTDDAVDKANGTHKDWNENDPTKPGYIKNRPFYTGDPVETDIIPPTTVTFSENGSGMIALWPESFDFVNGQTYHVSWDGTDYVCTGILFNGTISLLGNLGLAGVGDDTGEPFIFVKQNEWVVGSAESATEHIIGIKTVTNLIVTLDEKYLPESSFTKAEWSNISNKIVDYKRVNSSLSVVDKSIHAQVGDSYSDTINATLIFENRKVYRVSGTAKFTNTRVNKIFTFNIDVTSTVSDYKIYLGSFYDDLNEATVEVYLYSSNSPFYEGELSLNYDGTYGVTYTFSLDITVNEEATVLPDICLSDSIQRVGNDIIIPSSTPDSTKKFKITVDDSGTITATEIGATS